MSIGILYESDEWSNRRLKEIIIKNGIAAEMIFMEDFRLEQHRPFPHSLYINRVFSSTDMREHFNSLGKEVISSYSMGSRYELYPDCPAKILEDSVKALKILDIEMGSLDFIENDKGMYYLIDVNATSNFTPDYIPLLGFDPIEKMAGYIIDKYPP